MKSDILARAKKAVKFYMQGQTCESLCVTLMKERIERESAVCEYTRDPLRVGWESSRHSNNTRRTVLGKTMPDWMYCPDCGKRIIVRRNK